MSGSTRGMKVMAIEAMTGDPQGSWRFWRDLIREGILNELLAASQDPTRRATMGLRACALVPCSFTPSHHITSTPLLCRSFLHTSSIIHVHHLHRDNKRVQRPSCPFLYASCRPGKCYAVFQGHQVVPPPRAGRILALSFIQPSCQVS